MQRVNAKERELEKPNRDYTKDDLASQLTKLKTLWNKFKFKRWTMDNTASEPRAENLKINLAPKKKKSTNIYLTEKAFLWRKYQNPQLL